MNEKIQPKDYYDFFPPNSHRTGDIWRHLPNFGIFSQPHSFGLIVTPACDLAQRKSETVTYLPISTIQEYLNSPAFYSEIWKDISQQLSKLKFSDLVNVPSRYELPLLSEISAIINKLEISKINDHGKQVAFDRFCWYEKYVEENWNGRPLTIEDVGKIFSAGTFDKITKKIVKNSFSVDIHFLPEDEKPLYSSAVPKHSVVLFRYAQSIPVEFIDEAQMSSDEEWSSRLSRLKKNYSIASAFDKTPIRLATLKDDFLSDLLSRYVSMQIRLGSRDFTDETVDRYTAQLKEDK